MILMFNSIFCDVITCEKPLLVSLTNKHPHTLGPPSPYQPCQQEPSSLAPLVKHSPPDLAHNICLPTQRYLELRQRHSHAFLMPCFIKNWPFLSVMDILQEFLGSSTIHGLVNISTAKVIPTFPNQISMLLLDQDCKIHMVGDCLSWIHQCWIFDW